MSDAIRKDSWIEHPSLTFAYLVAIPIELYDWCRRNDWATMQAQLVDYYVALYRDSEDGERFIFDQVHYTFHDAIREGLTRSASRAASLDSLRSSRPPGFLLPNHSDSGEYFDTTNGLGTRDAFSFGIQVFGISEDDEERLSGRAWNSVTRKIETIKDPRVLSEMRSDPLLRGESDAEAFNFLELARRTKQTWHLPTDLPQLSGLSEHVYFIGNGDNVKIGVSGDPEVRLRQLQTGHDRPLKLLGTVPGSSAKEKELHSLLAGRRGSGEWFSITEAEVALLIALLTKR